jgi:hypothetical protein
MWKQIHEQIVTNLWRRDDEQNSSTRNFKSVSLLWHSFVQQGFF